MTFTDANACRAEGEPGEATTMKRYVDRTVFKKGTGPNGRQVCRWCGEETKPPRRTWCSKACVDEYLSRSSSRSIRRLVFERDKGICTSCGLDTEKLSRILAHARRSQQSWNDRFIYYCRAIAPLRVQLGFNPSGTLWEADHITPVIEGGGQCGLENLRTLCTPCHKQATAELARRRARQRRDAKRGLLEVMADGM